MKLSYAVVLGALAAATPLWGVYAPVPEQEQGKALTVSVRAGVSHDSNLFGGATDQVGSTIWELAPRVIYNASVTPQTFVSAAYGLTLDEFDNRPGEKLLDSHNLTLRAAHAFSQSSTIDVNDVFMISRNPASLLNGVPLNADQSFQRNQVDAHYETPVTAKIGATMKARSIYYHYRNAILGRSLDRVENLYGLAGNYAVLPEAKLVAEYRHQDVFYRKLGEFKNKRSDFVMGGIDYEVARKVSTSARGGLEWRHRVAERSVVAPYAEFSAKYSYSETSFVSGGYAYTLEETSDTARFNDTKTNRFFVNVQQSLTAAIVASASADYEPAVLQGRRGVLNVDENSTRLGFALNYLPTKNWIVSASFDYDHVKSDDPGRDLDRRRVGIDVTYTF
jgi:hypothetical protein